MSDILSIAQAADVFPHIIVQTDHGPFSLPLLMVAIGGPESGGYNARAQGDPSSEFGGPECGGYTSWGWLQIHNSHAAYLAQQTDSFDPCAWASWLYVPTNCAKAALALLDLQDPWSSIKNAWYNTVVSGAWLAYLPQAESAMASLNASPSPAILQAAPIAAGLLIFGFLAVGSVLVAVGEIEGWNLVK